MCNLNASSVQCICSRVGVLQENRRTTNHQLGLQHHLERAERAWRRSKIENHEFQSWFNFGCHFQGISNTCVFANHRRLTTKSAAPLKWRVTACLCLYVCTLLFFPRSWQHVWSPCWFRNVKLQGAVYRLWQELCGLIQNGFPWII